MRVSATFFSHASSTSASEPPLPPPPPLAVQVGLLMPALGMQAMLLVLWGLFLPRPKTGAARVIYGSALWAPFLTASFGSRTSTSPREENTPPVSARPHTRWAAGLTV